VLPRVRLGQGRRTSVGDQRTFQLMGRSCEGPQFAESQRCYESVVWLRARIAEVANRLRANRISSCLSAGSTACAICRLPSGKAAALTRRELLASTKDELAEAVGNAHLQPLHPVVVQARVKCPDGQARSFRPPSSTIIGGAAPPAVRCMSRFGAYLQSVTSAIAMPR
jgi:hypothetical protein